MERTCGACGEAFDARSARATYCSSTCRSRAHRGQLGGEVRALRAAPGPAAAGAEAGGGGVAAQLEAELRGADRLNTTLGQIAMGLASRFDVAVLGAMSESALASLARQLEQARAAALKGVGQAQSAVSRHRDDLAARRAARGA